MTTTLHRSPRTPQAAQPAAKACATNMAVFFHPVLDIREPDLAPGGDHGHLSPEEQDEIRALRSRIETQAIDLCLECPFFVACHQEHLAPGAEPVHGIVAGTTEADRCVSDPAEAAPDTYTFAEDRGKSGKVNDEKVRSMTMQGQSASAIALALGCNERTVVRARKRMGVSQSTGSTEARCTSPVATVLPTPKAQDLPSYTGPQATVSHIATAAPGLPSPAGVPRLPRVSDAMYAIYSVLADGTAWHRDDLAALGVQYISDADAVATWERTNSTVDSANGERTLAPNKALMTRHERIEQGARAKVLNMLTASCRNHGRTVRSGPDMNEYSLHPDLLAAWGIQPLQPERLAS